MGGGGEGRVGGYLLHKALPPRCGPCDRGFDSRVGVLVLASLSTRCLLSGRDLRSFDTFRAVSDTILPLSRAGLCCVVVVSPDGDVGGLHNSSCCVSCLLVA